MSSPRTVAIRDRAYDPEHPLSRCRFPRRGMQCGVRGYPLADTTASSRPPAVAESLRRASRLRFALPGAAQDRSIPPGILPRQASRGPPHALSLEHRDRVAVVWITPSFLLHGHPLSSPHRGIAPVPRRAGRPRANPAGMTNSQWPMTKSRDSGARDPRHSCGTPLRLLVIGNLSLVIRSTSFTNPS
jgi:hypothetical protein